MLFICWIMDHLFRVHNSELKLKSLNDRFRFVSLNFLSVKFNFKMKYRGHSMSAICGDLMPILEVWQKVTTLFYTFECWFLRRFGLRKSLNAVWEIMYENTFKFCSTSLALVYTLATAILLKFKKKTFPRIYPNNRQQLCMDTTELPL